MSSKATDSVLDQDTAQVLFREGAMMIFLDVPEGTEFGIDYKCWRVGPKFKGVKMIPPGIHFIYYSAVSKEETTAPRTGFFYNFKAKEVICKKWDAKNEDISSAVVSDEELGRLEASKEQLDPYLGVYPYEHYRKWVSLTNHIRPELLDKIQPLCGKISSASSLQSVGGNTEDRQKMAAAAKPSDDKFKPSAVSSTERGLPDMKAVEGTELRLTQIPHRKFPDGASAAEITKYSMDHSYVLSSIIASSCADNAVDVLGELQFVFTCFLIGHVYEAFEQWKQLLQLLCSCEDALSERHELYSQFIGMLHHQLQEIPEDFFVDIISCENFLTSTLQTFFSLLEYSDADAGLRQRGMRFRDHLEKKFHWDFTAAPDEDDPVVVE